MRAWALLLLAGCGRFAFDESRDAPPDAVILGTGPFGNVQPIAELASTFDEDDPGVSRDGLELYWASKRTGVSKIWTSRRASRMDPWGAPEQVLETSLTTDDKGPELSPDSLTLYFDASGDLAMSTRPTRTASWSPAAVILHVVSVSVGTPAVCNQALRMYMRRVDSMSIDHIYVSNRATIDDTWPIPVAVTELESGLGDSGPWISADCDHMYFDSDRTQNGAVYLAYRDPMTDTFGVPIEMPEIRVLGSVHDVSLTSDEKYVVFSHRNTVNQLYEASR
jgi:hypothetical protein